MARLQLQVDQTGDLNPDQFTPSVTLVDENGDPLVLSGESEPVTAADVSVAAVPASGVTAGTLQAVIAALAARVQALEDAAV